MLIRTSYFGRLSIIAFPFRSSKRHRLKTLRSLFVTCLMSRTDVTQRLLVVVSLSSCDTGLERASIIGTAGRLAVFLDYVGIRLWYLMIDFDRSLMLCVKQLRNENSYKIRVCWHPKTTFALGTCNRIMHCLVLTQSKSELQWWRTSGWGSPCGIADNLFFVHMHGGCTSVLSWNVHLNMPRFFMYRLARCRMHVSYFGSVTRTRHGHHEHADKDRRDQHGELVDLLTLPHDV